MRILQYIALALFLPVFFTSCEEDSLPVVPSPAPSNYAIRIDNKPWNPSEAVVEISDGVMSISAYDQEGRLFQIKSTEIDTGTFPIFEGTAVEVTLKEANGIDIYTSKVEEKYEGTLRIQALDLEGGKLSCTFEAILRHNFSQELIAIEDGVLKDVPFFGNGSQRPVFIGLDFEHPLFNNDRANLLKLEINPNLSMSTTLISQLVSTDNNHSHTFIPESSTYHVISKFTADYLHYGVGLGGSVVTNSVSDFNAPLIAAVGTQLYGIKQLGSPESFELASYTTDSFRIKTAIDTLTSTELNKNGDLYLMSRVDGQLVFVYQGLNGAGRSMLLYNPITKAKTFRQFAISGDIARITPVSRDRYFLLVEGNSGYELIDYTFTTTAPIVKSLFTDPSGTLGVATGMDYSANQGLIAMGFFRDRTSTLLLYNTRTGSVNRVSESEFYFGSFSFLNEDDN